MDKDTLHQNIVPIERITDCILMLRGQRVILDADLARLYGVTTKQLNQQVKRNQGRFPDDFMFELSANEKIEVVTNCDHLQALKFSPVLPHAFTEHGTVMLASILNSPTAVHASIQVVRAFIRLRRVLIEHKDFARKLKKLEKKYAVHDQKLKEVFNAISDLMTPHEPKSGRRLGFRQSSSDKLEGFSRYRLKSH